VLSPDFYCRLGPPNKRYGLACSLICVIVTIRSSPLPLPPSISSVDEGPFFLPCAALFVFDCGKISPLSVRVLRSLHRLFPWGPLHSETPSPTTALGPSLSQQPLVVTRIHLLCLLTRKTNLRYVYDPFPLLIHRLDSTVYLLVIA